MRPIVPIFRRLRQLSEQYPFEDAIRKEVTQLVAKIDQEMLGLEFPEAFPPNLPVSVLSGTFYKHPGEMDCSLFTFPTTGDKLPLHDHPKMEGFIRPIKGKLLITSFSWLHPDKERSMIQQNGSISSQRPAKFEGTLLIDANSPEVVTLNSSKGNIHSIESTDGMAAFFDVLIPGYDQTYESVPCTYYNCQVQNPTVGKIYWLQAYSEWSALDLVHMGNLELPQVTRAELIQDSSNPHEV